MRHRALCLFALLSVAATAVTATAPPVQAPSLPDLLARAATYVDGYEHQLSAVVAEETYEQAVGSSSGRAAKNEHQVLHSDVMLLDLGGAAWVQFRDTYDIDGTPLREHDARLAQLFLQPSSDLLDRAQTVADESARHNLGVTRNINVPTMALAYLTGRNQRRSTFGLAGNEPVNGIPAAVLKWKEIATPPLIGIAAGTIETSGRFWLQPRTGAVLRSELIVVIKASRSRGLKGTVTVTYENQPALKLLVPAAMDEEYERDNGEVDTGHAAYANFRQYSVDVSTFKRGGG